MTSCREVCSWIDTFIDGELPLDRAVDTECHIAHCPNCAEHVRFERAFRGSLKQSVQTESVTSDILRERIERALVAERANARVYACTPINESIPTMVPRVRPPSTRERSSGSRAVRGTRKQDPSLADLSANNWGALSWRSLLPVAAAAAGAILWAGMHNQVQTPMSRASVSDLRLSELDVYLDSMVSRHRGSSVHPSTNQFSREDRLDPPFQLPPFQDVRSIENHSIPIRMPTSNASLSALRGASSVYEFKGHRVTFFAYETGTAPLRARLQGHSLKGHVVYTGTRQGYSVATVEEGPVGYAMTSDLSPMESAELIASAVDARVQH